MQFLRVWTPPDGHLGAEYGVGVRSDQERGRVHNLGRRCVVVVHAE